MKKRSAVFLGLVMIAAVLLDQLIKLWVEAAMPLYSRIDLVPFLSLLHTRNTGIAFSFLSHLDGFWLSAIAIIIIGFISMMMARTDPRQIFARLGFAFIIGGAVGNLIDRALRGYVVDYVYFHTPSWSFAVFNLADAFISVGAALVVLEEFITWRRDRKASRSPE